MEQPSHLCKKRGSALELQSRDCRDLHPDLRASVESLAANQWDRIRLLLEQDTTTCAARSRRASGEAPGPTARCDRVPLTVLSRWDDDFQRTRGSWSVQTGPLAGPH